MGEGNDRNKLCRCDSGKKYKHCHWGREELKKIEKWEVDKIAKGVLSPKKCMVPKTMESQCSSEIIRAHTVSKSSNLKLIARDGYIYSYDLSLFKLDKKHGKLDFDLVPISKASTFYGFCKYHDNEIFKPIEDISFVGSLEQFFLLSFRALSMELYKKYSNLELMQESLSFDSGKSQKEQLVFQSLIKDHTEGTNLAIRDIEKIAQDYNQSLVNKDYSTEGYIYYCIYLDNTPPVMCSGSIFPHYDFQGELIQDLNDFDLELDEIIFNAISIGNNKGAFIMFGKKTESAIKFIKSFHKIPNNLKVSAFLIFMFTCSENIFISPNWWDNLGSKDKQLLLDSANKNLLFDDTKPDYLLPINIEGISLEIEKIDTNI